MTFDQPLVSTIIPTIAAKEKAEMLKRAIRSVRASFAGRVSIIVVVNGKRFDNAVCEWLQTQPDVLFKYLPTPSLPDALIRGRELVSTPYFSTLDDDDEYLPGATDIKVAALEAQPDADVVVTNGYRHCNDEDVQAYKDILRVPHTPLKCLLEANWLNSGNALYRTTSIGIDYFTDYCKLREWTWLAFRMATSGKRIIAIDAPTFRIYDTPDSLSKSESYLDVSVTIYNRMLCQDLPQEITHIIQRRMAAAWHDMSSQSLKKGNRMKALKCHFHSLSLPGGLQYLPYSRKLLPFWPVG